VCHSSPFLDNLPPLGRRIRQKCQPRVQVELFDEFVAPMGGDCLKKGDDWHTPGQVAVVRLVNDRLALLLLNASDDAQYPQLAVVVDICGAITSNTQVGLSCTIQRMILMRCFSPVKDSSIPEKPTHHMLLLSFVIILQRLCVPNQACAAPRHLLDTLPPLGRTFRRKRKP